MAFTIPSQSHRIAISLQRNRNRIESQSLCIAITIASHRNHFASLSQSQSHRIAITLHRNRNHNCILLQSHRIAITLHRNRIASHRNRIAIVSQHHYITTTLHHYIDIAIPTSTSHIVFLVYSLSMTTTNLHRLRDCAASWWLWLCRRSCSASCRSVAL